MTPALAADGVPIGYWIGMVLGALGVGLVCGLIPLAVGALTKQKRIATIAFGSCLLGSFMGGAIAALPIALVFCIIILIKWNRAPDASRQKVEANHDTTGT